MRTWIEAGKTAVRALRDRFLARHLESLDRLRTRLEDLERRERARDQELEGEVRRLSETIRCLAEAAAVGAQVPVPDDHRPLVTVVMPAWNAGATLAAAVESVRAQSYPHWELRIVDDGSEDSTLEVAGGFADDPRVHLVSGPHQGVCRARNLALEASCGELVAYLDADNSWYPHFLAQVVSALAARPDQACVYLSQLVHREGRALPFVRGVDFDLPRLEQTNFIDLNVFAHRRRAYQRWGGFDESFERLNDWELILRYSHQQAPLYVPVLGGRYHQDRPQSISATRAHWWPHYRVRRKHQHPQAAGLRVLYALEEFPQRSETYIRWEMECMRRWGVEVEVWRSRDLVPASPYPVDVPVHSGRLSQAIDAFQPHLVHAHWLHVGVDIAAEVARTGRTMTVRGHSFEHHPHRIHHLLGHSFVEAVYTFEHFCHGNDSPKLRPLNVSLNGDLYHPGEKDRRLVLRTAAGLPYKDIGTFLQVATRCPEFRFVLALTKVHTHEAFLEELAERNASLGGPVEIRIDVPTEELAATVRRAGVYLHTNDPSAHPFGMPISIAEAMACGAHLMARRSHEAAWFLGDRADLYQDVDQAVALLRATLDWPEQRWSGVERRNSEFAFRHYGDLDVLGPLLEHWREIARRRAGFLAPRGLDLGAPLREYLERDYAEPEPHRSAFVAHNLSVGLGLRNAGCEERVWKAGALHAAFGTSRRTDGDAAPPSDEARAEVRALVGQDSEALVYLYGVMDTEQFYRRVEAEDTAPEVRHRFTGTSLPLDRRQFEDLCHLHLFDHLEKIARGGTTARRPLLRRLAHRLGGAARAAHQSLLP